MSKPYFVRPGDTLSKIARREYGDASLADEIAQYNGILNPDWIRAGQKLVLPSKRDLTGGTTPSVSTHLTPPRGLTAILKTFGNIFDYLGSDGRPTVKWETDQLGFANLPFAIPLSWDQSKSVTKLYCHRKLISIFENVFSTIQTSGLTKHIKTYGGCYAFRRMRTNMALSTHSWGIAIDLNPETNALGTKGDLHSSIVDVFENAGFIWGGRWAGAGKDPMHFQYCEGY
jgi:LysM repeat protein